ncbi:MAG: hypothetical protein R3D71_08800 [Rickettsiales bacterium]
MSSPSLISPFFFGGFMSFLKWLLYPFDNIRESKKNAMLIYRTPRIVLIIVFLIFIALDLIVIKLNISSFFAVLFAYVSALILLLELIHETGIKVFSEHLGMSKNQKNIDDKKNLDLKIPFFYWSLTYLWFVTPVNNFIRKIIGVQLFGWSKEEDMINTYKLRFIAFIFLIFAINFDVCTRIFGK